jgi:hypothetical protein
MTTFLLWCLTINVVSCELTTISNYVFKVGTRYSYSKCDEELMFKCLLIFSWALVFVHILYDKGICPSIIMMTTSVNKKNSIAITATFQDTLVPLVLSQIFNWTIVLNVTQGLPFQCSQLKLIWRSGYCYIWGCHWKLNFHIQQVYKSIHAINTCNKHIWKNQILIVAIVNFHLSKIISCA